MKTVKLGQTTKILLKEGDKLFSQGDEGDLAYMIVYGHLDVLVDDKKKGIMRDGELFGELSLILGENRSCSIKAIVPTEIVVISKKALEEILLSSNLELHKVIQEISKELAKKSDHKLPISHKDLVKLIQKSPNVIKSLSLQLHHRLSQRIY